MNVYGLTGGIASGKSTVARILRARGIPVIDADEVAREVLEPGTPGLAAVLEAFGPTLVRPDGALDRDALARIIFSDPEARQRLNQIVHPRVQAAMAERVLQLASEGAPLAIMDIPLLYEARDPASFAGIIVVYVTPETQLARLMHRNGYTHEEAGARIRSQMPLAEKARRATYVIDNEGTGAETEAQIDLLLERLTMEAASRA